MDEYLLTDEEFRMFRDLIVRTTGTSIPVEKRAMMRSRLQKRLRFNEVTSFQEYYDLIVGEGKRSPELRELVNCLSASRQASLPDPNVYSEMVEQIFAEVGRESSKRVRIWVAGCSMGQATYSLAIAFHEALMKSKQRYDVKLLASDNDLFALARAESGVYEWELADGLQTEIREQYLKAGAGTRADYVKMQPMVREMITFRQIDLAQRYWPMHQNMRYDAILLPETSFSKTIAARLRERLTYNGLLVVGTPVAQLHSDEFTAASTLKAA